MKVINWLIKTSLVKRITWTKWFKLWKQNLQEGLIEEAASNSSIFVYLRDNNFITEFKNPFKSPAWAINAAESLMLNPVNTHCLDNYFFYFKEGNCIIFPIKKNKELYPLIIIAIIVDSCYVFTKGVEIEVGKKKWIQEIEKNGGISFLKKILKHLEKGYEEDSYIKFSFGNSKEGQESFNYFRNIVFFLITPYEDDYYFFEKEIIRRKVGESC